VPNGLTKGPLLQATATLFILFSGSGAAAQSQAATKVLHAYRVPSPVKVDGVLDEDSWHAAEAAADFVQQDPDVGEPVSEATEVRVLVDHEAIYFGIVCHDADPHGVIARELRRDNTFADDDHIEILLDTFHDHRNAFHFAINPLGTQYDALITDEGHDINAEWNERWWSEARITSDGWRAEIKIPLTTLRSNRELDTFGLNFKRYIRRKAETAHWTGWSRDFPFLQVSQAGHLTGVDRLETGLKLRVKPYLLGGVRNTRNPTTDGVDRLTDVGLETVRFSVTPGLTAEVTANTDFAQTEVDDAVVNLTRFPLFFPEKREFFLERAGIFEFGFSGRRGARGAQERNLQMYFSRRIGLTEDRVPVPVKGGAKLVGHAAGLDIGLLDVQTGTVDAAAGSNYFVFRGKRNVLARSNIGVFASNRQATSTDYNRVIGADANFTIFKNTDIQGFLAKSSTPGLNGNDYAGRAKYNWFTDLHEIFVEHLYVGPAFKHDVGFVRRTGIQRTDAAYIWQPRPTIAHVRNFVFRNELVYTTDIQYTILGREQISQWTTRFQSDDATRINTTHTFDRVERAFEIASGVIVSAGDYGFRDTWVEYEGSGKRTLAGRIRYGGGGFYGGTRKYVQIAPAFRPMSLISVDASYEYNDVTLPQGAFTTHVVNGRVNVNVSNKWLTTTLAQYDSASSRRVLFFRLNYIFRPGDNLFFVVNQTTQPTLLARDQRDRAVMLKWTYAFDF
jgi:Domain of unknown function (DUF5916)/Carbohydrate family 9 binding domain-like